MTFEGDDDADDEDDKYSLLSPKERLRCASEMEKSVDSSAVNVDGASGCGGNTELMLRCIRAMQYKRPTPACVVTAAASSEVTLQVLLRELYMLPYQTVCYTCYTRTSFSYTCLSIRPPSVRPLPVLLPKLTDAFFSNNHVLLCDFSAVICLIVAHCFSYLISCQQISASVVRLSKCPESTINTDMP